MPAVSFPADLDSLGQANAFLADALPAEFRSLGPQVELALEELWVNIAGHAYAPDRPGRIELEAGPAGGGFRLILRDWGRPFDPFTQAPRPDLEAELPDRPIGGLGVHLVKTLARSCRYRRLGDCNQVELVFAAGKTSEG
ncbi:MAG: ATP-binding protein [Candidatus Adiutrix sp.]|jgi:anti-sigma regulatory factor (Ser/Thr protein kinase)|nr:ATP-binding protein [Candidatus Adiutrix sp.]